MNSNILSEIDGKIKLVKKQVKEIIELGGETKAIVKNSERILACVKMLELQVCDLIPYVT